MNPESRTPLTDAAMQDRRNEPSRARLVRMAEHARTLETQNAELRKALSRLWEASAIYAACQDGATDERCGLVQPISVADGVELLEALEQADRVLVGRDPENLEGPSRTPEQLASEYRALNAVAPTPADKFALMFRGPAPSSSTMNTTPPLHRIDYQEIDGKLVDVETHDLFVWAAVDTSTGRVDLSETPECDDNLGPLIEGWEWRRFRLVEAPSTP